MASDGVEGVAGEVLDDDLLLVVADVDEQGLLGGQRGQRDDRLDRVGHVAERPGLVGAVDLERVGAAEEPFDELRDHMVVAHPGPVHIVEADHPQGEAVGAGVRPAEHFAGDLAEAVRGAGHRGVRHQQRYVLGGGHGRGPGLHAPGVRLAGGGEAEGGPAQSGEPVEEVDGGEQIGAQHPAGVVVGVDDAHDRGQVVDLGVVVGEESGRYGCRQVVLDEGDPAEQFGQLGVGAAPAEVVEEGDVAAVGEPAGQMQSDEARAAGDQDLLTHDRASSPSSRTGGPARCRRPPRAPPSGRRGRRRRGRRTGRGR